MLSDFNRLEADKRSFGICERRPVAITVLEAEEGTGQMQKRPVDTLQLLPTGEQTT